jgi:hypothetical protein
MLRGHRDVQQWSLRDLAEACGVSHVYVRDVESGRKFPSATWFLTVGRRLSWDPKTVSRAWLQDAYDQQLAELIAAEAQQ